MEKVLLFCDPGIDDSVAIMYALLHPDIELVGIVTGYGNVDQEQATNNAAYLLSLAGREDIPIYAGARFPLSGELAVFYPEIHGENGLGPIQPPDEIKGDLLNFTDLFDVIEQYEGELTIVDVGRLTSLAMAFILGGEVMEKVKQVVIMGGSFLNPGNVTPLSEANFYGDPIAANLVMARGERVTLVPLNVTNYAIVTDRMITDVTQEEFNSFTALIEPVYSYYADAYAVLVPEIEGAPFHDVVALMTLVEPDMFDYAEKPVSVSADPATRGQSIADFRPSAEWEEETPVVRVAMDFVYDRFAKNFVQTMKLGTE
ncbi:nucleoside hydrolase [Bacillus sp. H-16]|uniref:nucleoside hydrolase n=1 Tax=Alteribacter salitolerans TaxID=2912333 RepID=UPI0019664836|nr:nucleoside hydrolase [Alteribacter salitolerans]MBM7095279.1 nucleoside hydrolase [Alteribacter salitolerans]